MKRRETEGEGEGRWREKGEVSVTMGSTGIGLAVSCNIVIDLISSIKMNESFPIVSDLALVFPDIEGELCSRHSILFGKLKNSFNKIYDNLDPHHYTVLKGILTLYHQHEVDLSMALENGLILMSRPIDQGQSLYINSNHFDQQLILTCHGKLEEGLNEHTDAIETAIRAANEGLAEEQLRGGIFYLHGNIAENCFRIFLGVSLVNNNLKQFSLCQLIDRMAKHEVFGSRQELEQLFGFKNRQFSLTVGSEQFSIPLQKQSKMVLCQVDLAKMDIKFQDSRKRQLLQLKQHVLEKAKAQYNFNSLLQVFEQEEDVLATLDFSEEIINEDEPLTPNNYVQIALKELGLLSEFNQGNISFEQLVSAQWQLNSQYWKIHPEEVIELVEEIKTALNINSCMIINETYALILADKTKYTELLVFLRQKLHKGELKSKSLFKIEEELVQHRWSSDKNIGEKMFSSVPSCAVSVFDPAEAIWFD